MIHIQKPTDKARYFVAYSANGTRHVGITEVGSRTMSGQERFIDAADVDELVDGAIDLDFTNWKEVPAEGEYVNRGIYSYGGKLIVCYQDHVRTEHAIEDIPALFGVYKGAGSELVEWVQPVGAHDAYKTGDEVMFNSVHYRSVIDANVWSPSVYPAGWEEVVWA